MRLSEPRIEERAARPYVALRAKASMVELDAVLPPMFDGIFTWLSSKGATPAGAPFIRYIVIDMDAELDFEVGLPVETSIPGDERFSSGMLPAGPYAVTVHTGPYDELVAATGWLLQWAEEHGVKWQADGDTWASRLEWYLTDPQEEPNPERWQTELAFLTASP
jgi:effector-binding domain-containing protein